MHKVKYLVSACLCGIGSRFDGKDARDDRIAKLVKKGEAIPVCPEELGGLPIPRPPGEIEKGDGEDVLSQPPPLVLDPAPRPETRCRRKGSDRRAGSPKSKVISRKGEDLTPFFLKGAFASLVIAKRFKIKRAILKQNSPSCGCGWIKRKGKRIKGDGVTTNLFKKEGIQVIPR